MLYLPDINICIFFLQGKLNMDEIKKQKGEKIISFLKLQL